MVKVPSGVSCLVFAVAVLAPAQEHAVLPEAPAQTIPALASVSTHVSAGSTAAAKPAELDEDQPIAIFRKQVQEVDVVFTVTNHHGRPIKHLRQDEFQVLDDHKPPESILRFVSQTDLPLSVGLLIDTSSSVRDRFSLEQQAALEFLSEILRPGSDQAFIMGFHSGSEITQDFTGDRNKLAGGLRALHARGGTAMYDAIYYACRNKLMLPDSDKRRRAIVLLSDGEDNQSRFSLQDAVEMAQRAEVIIYVVSTNYSNIKMHGDSVMEELAEASGGRAFFPLRIKDVAGAFRLIEEELRSQYALAYKPAELKTDGHYHSIEIVLADNRKYRVRARKGYYAPTR